jgi:hypothetical protein
MDRVFGITNADLCGATDANGALVVGIVDLRPEVSAASCEPRAGGGDRGAVRGPRCGAHRRPARHRGRARVPGGIPADPEESPKRPAQWRCGSKGPSSPAAVPWTLESSAADDREAKEVRAMATHKPDRCDRLCPRCLFDSARRRWS